MRLVGVALVTLGIAVAVVALLVRLNEARLIYFPIRGLDVTPAALGLAFEDLALQAADGTRLHGWFVPAPRAGPIVLFLHGNAGNISHRLEKIAILHRLGAAVCIIDYRGYGRSEGSPSEAGLYLDGRAALAHLLEHRRVGPGSVILYGESLGSAVAVDVALETRIGGVVLEAGFSSVRDVASDLSPLPLGLFVATRFDTVAKLPRVAAPILILHSRGDELIGMDHATRLRQAATSPAELVELQGGHNDAFLVSADVYQRALAAFLGSVPPSPAAVASQPLPGR